MKIGIISDTHGFIDDKVIKHLQGCDEIWHGGDWGSGVEERLESIAPLRGVYGNIDGQHIRTRFPKFLAFGIEGFRVLMTHIIGSGTRIGEETHQHIERNKPDILIHGHSHILKIERNKQFGFIQINPGAAGRHGFHHVRTLVRMDIENKKIREMYVVELGPRAEIGGEL